jgi:DNA end-binding protein Ku
MAPRPTWSGALQINGPLQAHVSLTKGTESYRGKEALTELCSCHQRPFQRKTVCVEGFTRLTQEMEKAGETDGTTTVVKGVPNGDDGDYTVLSEEQLQAIENAGSCDTITIAAILNPDEIPLERLSGFYYITHNKKVKGSKKPVRLLYEALAKPGKIAVARWAPKGREMLIVIRPLQGRLVASVVLYDSEVRDHTPFQMDPETDVAPEEVDLAIQLLGRLPEEFDFDSVADRAVAVRQQAIEAARAGKPIPTQAPAKPAEEEPELMSVLRAAVEATSDPAANEHELAAAN